MKVYHYGRVSSKGQQERGFGIKTQLEAMMNFSASNLPEAEIVVIKDEAVSGSTSIEDREGLLSLISMMKKGDVLLAYDYSRISRSTVVMAMVEQQVKAIGGKVMTVVGNNDESPEAILMKNILVSLAEYQRVAQNIKIKMAFKKKKETHKLGRVAPYGYRYNEDRTEYIEVEEEQEVIRVAVSFMNEDLTNNKKYGFYSRLSRHLNDNMLQTREGSVWLPSNTNRTFKTHTLGR